MPYRRSHFSYLSVSAFPHSDLDPGRWNRFPESDGNRPGWKLRRFFEQAHRCSFRTTPFENYAGAKFRQSLRRRNSLNLNKIRAFMTEPRLKKLMLERAIICEKQEPFTVAVQPPDRIYVLGKRSKRTQSLPAGTVGELAEYAIRLVEDNVDVSAALGCLGHKSGEKKIPRYVGGFVTTVHAWF